MSFNDREKRALNFSAQTDISRSTIDRDNWKRKKRNISEEQNIKKKVYDQARGRTRVNIGAAFQWWENLKEQEGPESDAEVVLFLLDRWVTIDLAFSHNLSMLAFVWICLCVIFTCFWDRRCQGCVRTCGAENQNRGKVLFRDATIPFFLDPIWSRKFWISANSDRYQRRFFQQPASGCWNHIYTFTPPPPPPQKRYLNLKWAMSYPRKTYVMVPGQSGSKLKPGLITINMTPFNNQEDIHYSPSSVAAMLYPAQLFAHSSCTSLLIYYYLSLQYICPAHFILSYCTFYSYLFLFYFIYVYSLVLC